MFKVLAFPRVLKPGVYGVIQLSPEEPSVELGGVDFLWVKQALQRFPNFLPLLKRSLTVSDHPIFDIDLGVTGFFSNLLYLKLDVNRQTVIQNQDTHETWEDLGRMMACLEKKVLDLGEFGEFSKEEVYIRSALLALAEDPTIFKQDSPEGRQVRRILNHFGLGKPHHILVPGVGRLSTDMTALEWAQTLVEKKPNNARCLARYAEACLDEMRGTNNDSYKEVGIQALERGVQIGENVGASWVATGVRQWLRYGLEIGDELIKGACLSLFRKLIEIDCLGRYSNHARGSDLLEIYEFFEDYPQLPDDTLSDQDYVLQHLIGKIEYLEEYQSFEVGFVEVGDREFRISIYGKLDQGNRVHVFQSGSEDMTISSKHLSDTYTDLAAFCCDFGVTKVTFRDGRVLRVQDFPNQYNLYLSLASKVNQAISISRRKIGALEKAEIYRETRYLAYARSRIMMSPKDILFCREFKALEWDPNYPVFFTEIYEQFLRLRAEGMLSHSDIQKFYRAYKAQLIESYYPLDEVALVLSLCWREMGMSLQEVRAYILGMPDDNTVENVYNDENKRTFIMLGGLLAKTLDSDESVVLPNRMRPYFDNLEVVTRDQLMVFVDDFTIEPAIDPIYSGWSRDGLADFASKISLKPNHPFYYYALARSLSVQSRQLYSISFFSGDASPVEICFKLLDFLPVSLQFLETIESLFISGANLRLAHTYLPGLREYCERMPMVSNFMTPLVYIGQLVYPFVQAFSFFWSESTQQVIQLPNGEVVDEERLRELISRYAVDREVAIFEIQRRVASHPLVPLRLDVDQLREFDYA